MSHPSQIFQLLLSPGDYEALIHEKIQLENERNRLNGEVNELKERVTFLSGEVEKGQKNPRRIAHLSKSLLQLGRLTIDYQERCEQLMRERESMQQVEAVAKLAAQKQKAFEYKLSQIHREMNQLIQTIKSLKSDIEEQIQENKKLAENALSHESQFSSLQQAFTDKTAQTEMLKMKIQRLEDEVRDRDYLLLNERNIVKEQSKNLQQKSQNLKEYEFNLDLKSKEIVNKYEQAQQQKELQEQMYKQRLDQLQAEFANKSLELQQKYSKQIASIREFSTTEQQIDQLREELIKLKTQNTNMAKRISKLKKQNVEAVDRITYLKEYYEDVENADHSIMTIYLKSLVAFRDKLVNIGESDIVAKVNEKKNQMVKALEKQLNQVMSK